MEFLTIKNKLLNTGLFYDNEWIDMYINLVIDNALDTKTPNSQKHHIIPRSVYKLLNEDVDNSKGNVVNLDYPVHILAHGYLALASSDGRTRINNSNAFNFMCGMSTNYIINNSQEKFLIELKEKYSDCFSIKGDSHYLSGRCGELNSFYGKHHTEDTKRKISKSKTNPSDETRKKLRDSHIGKSCGENHPMYGKHHTKESIEKMRKSHENISDDTREKMRKSAMGNTSHCKKVICLETNVVYKSIKNAVIDTGVSNKAISRSIKTGKPCRQGLHFKLMEK